jgi:hypothetical protein
MQNPKRGKSVLAKEEHFLRFRMKAVSLLGVNFISNERRDFCEKNLNGRSSVNVGPVHACGMLEKQ